MAEPAMTQTPDTALLMIDIQNDFCPGGALAVAEGDAIVGLVNASPDIREFRFVPLLPFAHTETVADDGSYLFSYLPAGNYTLAFSCDATEDLPEYDDDIIIPSPEGELVEVVMSPGERWVCDFTIGEDGCELLLPETEPEPLP